MSASNHHRTTRDCRESFYASLRETATKFISVNEVKITTYRESRRAEANKHLAAAAANNSTLLEAMSSVDDVLGAEDVASAQYKIDFTGSPYESTIPRKVVYGMLLGAPWGNPMDNPKERREAFTDSLKLKQGHAKAKAAAKAALEH